MLRAVALGSALFVTPLAATPEGPEYSVNVWQAEDGLPQNAVTAIVQTRDGYLWVGTYGGLARFDGVRFSVFDGGNTPELHNSRVTALFEDADRHLWIGHETGDLTRFRHGRFQSVQLPGAPNQRPVAGLGADSTGKLWLVNQDGVLKRLEDGKVLVSECPPDRSATSVTFTRSERSGLWFARGGVVWKPTGDHLETLDLDPSVDRPFVLGIGASQDDGLWVVMDGRVRQWRERQWVEDRGGCAWEESSITTVLELRNGCLAVGTLDRGLYLLFPNRRVLHFNRSNGLPHDWVRCLCEDREGNLWAGVGSGGLVALRPARVVTVNPPDRWQGRAVLSVAAGRDGALWVGTEGAGLYRLQDGQWSRFTEDDGVSNLFVWSVAEDNQGRLWAGTWGGGLLERRGERFQRASGLENTTVPMPALFSGAERRLLWVGTGAGLLRYDEGEVTWFGRQNGLTTPDVRAVTVDGEGTVWFGMYGGGLGRLQDGVCRQYRKSDGLSSDFVQCLLPDADGSLWVGTADGGLNRMRGDRFSVIGSRQGLPNHVICHLVDDGYGFLWMSTHGGLVRVSKDELNRCADGRSATVRCQTFGRSDGLPTLECSGGLQPAGCQMPDGRLWFTTTHGLVTVDPAKVSTNSLVPPVVIEEVWMDGQPVEVLEDSAAPRRIPPGRQRFEFRYTGLSFSAPEKMRFKYRLEGLETDWVEREAKRSAEYSHLPPGHYRFQVQACNNDGVWNESGASWTFTVLPFFWQTWWFRGLSGGAALCLAAGVVLYGARRRTRGRIERVERQHAVERERARIAQDMHDDLGASLTRITLLSESARGELDDPRRAAEDIDRIYDTARELTRTLDEIVWAVNPRHDTLDSLASYLGRFAQDFVAAAGLRCRLDVPVRLPPWPLTAEMRHNVFLAFKEALHNTLKHAGASEVRISLALEPAAFSLTVEDDGRGFDPEAVAANLPPDSNRIARGDGIANMRQRLAALGGRCEIHSRPGNGTRVTFFVAAPGHSKP